MKPLALTVLLFACVACLGCSTAKPCCGTADHADARAQIKAMLNQAAADWTANDLDGFMQSYADSPDLRFAHPKGITLGYDTVKERYARSIEKSDLTFSDLDVAVLAPDAAVAFGRFHNHGKDGSYATGLFTLLVRQIDGKWKVVHDHSSDLPSETPAGP